MCDAAGELADRLEAIRLPEPGLERTARGDVRAVTTIPATAGSSSRLSPPASITRQLPSLCRARNSTVSMTPGVLAARAKSSAIIGCVVRVDTLE